MEALCDPCDGWVRPAPRGYYWPVTEREHAVCMEGFEPRTATPILAKFLTDIQTDWSHWSYDTDWTLESGPDEAPSSVDIVVPYNYRGSTPDSWTEPGDPAEVETGTPWFVDDSGARCEVNLIEAERERIETWIYENPPDPDYPEDWR
jgi:hypothetical protein